MNSIRKYKYKPEITNERRWWIKRGLGFEEPNCEKANKEMIKAAMKFVKIITPQRDRLLGTNVFKIMKLAGSFW